MIDQDKHNALSLAQQVTDNMFCVALIWIHTNVVFLGGRNELKFSIQDGTKVKLYPEEEEPLNVLNLKRGIISALLVPTETVENVKTIPMVGLLKASILLW